LSSGIKVVLFIVISLALLGFTQVPNSIQYAYGAGCAPEDVQHWEKIVFRSGGVVHPTLPNLASPAEVVVQIDPNVAHVVQQLVVDKLTSLGYTQLDGSQLALSNIASDSFQVSYSAFCNNFGLAQIVGGMFIQPDSATLLLAYGIANAIWIAPIGIGIGVGIYLVKRKL